MAGQKRSQHLRLAFKDIELATKNFETCIGKGGYGRVYKGELSISGKLTTVAVKRLDVQFGQGLKEFLTEIELLTGLQHPNLICLLGYCDEGDEKIIVYEYAERGSLEQYLRHNNISYMTLTWLERLRICIDAASGLNHLHSHFGKHQSIIHRDIKSANILVDEKWVAKISDFGLSKLSLAGLDRSAVISNACGTPGYCEPEYIFSGIVTKKSDVYSFGMVLFEVLCGKLCTVRDKDGSLLSAKLVKECYKNKKLDEIIDPSLMEQMSSYAMSKFSAIAYRCLDDDRERRPPMDVVKKELEEILEIQGQPQVNKSTWRRHLEPKYDVSNGHLNQSIDNDNHQKLASSDVLSNAPVDRVNGQMVPYEEPNSNGSNSQLKLNAPINNNNRNNKPAHSEATTARNSSRSKDGEPQGDDEWVVQDEPGVYITLTSLPGGAKDLKRVRFSKNRFSAKQAEQWWAENRTRVYEQYNVRMLDKSSVGIPNPDLPH